MAERAGATAVDLVRVGVVFTRRTHPVWIGEQRTTRCNARRELGVAARTRRTPAQTTATTVQ